MLNPARAQKVNKFIWICFYWSFTKLKEILNEKQLLQSPHLIYNIDEKKVTNRRITPPKEGEKSVHDNAPEHAENVTGVACANALGQAIPPMVLFKGKRKKDEWIDGIWPAQL